MEWRSRRVEWEEAATSARFRSAARPVCPWGYQWKTELCNKDVSNRKGRKQGKGGSGNLSAFCCSEKRRFHWEKSCVSAGIVGSVRLSVSSTICGEASSAPTSHWQPGRSWLLFSSWTKKKNNIVTSGVWPSARATGHDYWREKATMQSQPKATRKR